MNEIVYDLFYPELDIKKVNKISILGLAHVGDAVYELMTRTFLCCNEHNSSVDLHRTAVSLVNANAQAEAATKILPHLNEFELSIYRRGRNAKVNSVPHNSGVAQYHSATGLEALFGWLFLSGKKVRLNELFNIIMEFK